jgi:DNA-binding NarL/FixJ family response regulator
MEERRTILVIRSRDLGWDALRRALDDLPQAHVVGDVADAGRARQLARAHQPDVILCALSVGGKAALPLLTELRRAICPHTRLVVCAMQFSLEQLVALADLGVMGFLQWGDLCAEMLHQSAPTIVTPGLLVHTKSPALVYRDALHEPLGARGRAVHLSPRERSVLERLDEGLNQKEIAKVEGISLSTVKRVNTKLKEKLNASSPFAMGVVAARLGVAPKRE